MKKIGEHNIFRQEKYFIDNVNVKLSLSFIEHKHFFSTEKFFCHVVMDYTLHQTLAVGGNTHQHSHTENHSYLVLVLEVPV